MTANNNDGDFLTVEDEQVSIKKRYRHSQQTLLFIVFCVICVLIINGMDRQHEYLNHQNQLIENSISGVIDEFSRETRSLHANVSQFSKLNTELLHRVIDQPYDFSAREKLSAEAVKTFPSLYEIVVTDQSGNIYSKNTSGTLSEDTKNDIISYVKYSNHPRLSLHKHSNGYYFNILTQIDRKSLNKAILVISIFPTQISKILANNQLPRHRLILLDSRQDGLIEVTSTGTRQGLENILLSQKDKQSITRSMNIKGANWLLVDVAIENFIVKHQQGIWLGIAWQLFILLILSFFMHKKLSSSSKMILLQNNELRRQAHLTQKQNIRLERAQTIAQIGYWDYDAANDLIIFSENAKNLLKLENTKQRAEDFYKLIEPKDKYRVRYHLASSIVRNKIQQIEFAVKLNSNEKRIFLASTEISLDSVAKPLHLFGIIQDITKQREVENISRNALTAQLEAEASNKSKSSFLANMSHEIRTPMNSIIGFAESLLDSTVPEENRKDAIKTIIRNGYHLLKIINDILDLSKIEANKLEVESIKMEIFPLLRDVESLIKPQAIDKGIDFEIIYDFPIPATITSDPLRLKQILINLSSNAMKFTEVGYINIHVHYNKETNLIYFDVIDTGIGMTTEQADKVFRPFTQADTSTTRKYGGTGLGLSLSLDLAKNLGGGITVTSEANLGSTFTLCIFSGDIQESELTTRKQDIPHTEDTHLFAIPSNTHIGDVLLAEDTVDNQNLFSMYIQKVGANVTVVENGELAVTAAMKKSYDLIFMDMQMPVMGGVRAVQILRQRGYKSPIVALTANAMASDKHLCIENGFDGFVAKPIDRQQFFSVLQRYLHPVSNQQDSHHFVSTLLAEDSKFLDLVEKFVHKLPAISEKLSTLIKASLWKELKMELHDLKGCAGNYGYFIITEAAREMEQQVINKNQKELEQLMLKFEKLSDRIHTKFEQTKHAS